MFDTADEILRRLRAGEDGRVEFKDLRFGRRGVVSPNTEDFAAELVAFANAEGGFLFLGVDDSGKPTGIPRDKLDLAEQWAVNVAADRCSPPIRPVIRRERVPTAEGEASLVLVEVRRGLYVHRTARGRYHLRVGSTRRDLDTAELARLFQDRGREYVFDERAVLTATAADLSDTKLEAHFGIAPTIPWPDLLRNTKATIRGQRGGGPSLGSRPARLRPRTHRPPDVSLHRSRMLRRHPPHVRRPRARRAAGRSRGRPDRLGDRLRHALHAAWPSRRVRRRLRHRCRG